MPFRFQIWLGAMNVTQLPNNKKQIKVVKILKGLP